MNKKSLDAENKISAFFLPIDRPGRCDRALKAERFKSVSRVICPGHFYYMPQQCLNFSFKCLKVRFSHFNTPNSILIFLKPPIMYLLSTLVIGTYNNYRTLKHSLQSHNFTPHFALKKPSLYNHYKIITVLFLLFILQSYDIVPAYTQPITLKASYYTIKSCLKESGQYQMANGRRLNDKEKTCASWDYPFGTILKITNRNNSRSVVVSVTDRGPAKKLYEKGIIIDLSYAAMYQLDGIEQGHIPIKITRFK